MKGGGYPYDPTLDLAGRLWCGFYESGPVKRLMDDGANPHDEVIRYGRSVMITAIMYNRKRLIRIMCTAWPPSNALAESYVNCAINGRRWEALQCLLELGMPIQPLRFARLLQLQEIEHEDRLDRMRRHNIANLYPRFMDRQTACFRTTCAILSAQFTPLGLKLPRDMARMLAQEVWRTRRAQVWESEESLELWAERMAQWQEIANEFDDEIVESDESSE